MLVSKKMSLLWPLLFMNNIFFMSAVNPYATARWWKTITYKAPNIVASIFQAFEYALTVGEFSDEIVYGIRRLPSSLDTPQDREEFEEGLKYAIILEVRNGKNLEAKVIRTNWRNAKKNKESLEPHVSAKDQLDNFYETLEQTIRKWNISIRCLQEIFDIRLQREKLSTDEYKEKIKVALIREVMESERRFHEESITEFVHRLKHEKVTNAEKVENEFEALRFSIMLNDFSDSVARKLREAPTTFDPPVIQFFFLRRIRNAILDEIEDDYIFEIEKSQKRSKSKRNKQSHFERKIHKFYPQLLNVITKWNISDEGLQRLLKVRMDCDKETNEKCIVNLKRALGQEIVQKELEFRIAQNPEITANK